MARLFAKASTQYLEASYSLSVAPVTFACWYRPASESGTAAHVLMACSDPAAQTLAFRMSMIESSVYATTYQVGASAHSITAGTLADNTWGHCGAVFASATSRTAYLNGTAATTNTTNINANTLTRFNIGIFSRNNSRFEPADGRIADAAMWTVALSANEMAALAKGASPLRIRRESLAGYWPLYGFQSPEQNLAGALSLTVTNSPTQAEHAPVAPHSRKFWPASAPYIASNAAPTANAGDDQTIILPATATLNGSGTDDGLPAPITYSWAKQSGPGTVTFSPNNATANAVASFSEEGTYVLRLTVSDTELSHTDDVTITVNPIPTNAVLTPQVARRRRRRVRFGRRR